MDAIDKLVFEELAEGESFRLKMTRHDMSGFTWFTLNTADKSVFCRLADPFVRSGKTMIFAVVKAT